MKRALVAGVFLLIILLIPLSSNSAAIDYETIIDFETFPDGTPIFTNPTPNSFLRLSDQFQSLGVLFENLYPNDFNGGPIVIHPQELGGILISGGPTGFYGDIKIDFVSPLVTNFVTIQIVGSGLNIGASLTAFGRRGEVLDTITHYYYGTTGIPSAMTIITPPGREIESVLFNGGLNPSAAAIKTLEFGRVTPPVPEPSTLILLGSGLVGLLGFRRREFCK